MRIVSAAMALANDVTPEALRELAETHAEQETVLSLYLDLDPSRFATPAARQSEIDSLLDEAHREIEGAERPHAELMALRAALARTGETLKPQGSEMLEEARALALFVCEPLALWRQLRLPHPVSRAAIVSHEPFIAPLVESGPAGRLCVALVDERFARILRGSAEKLREASSFGDPVHGRNDQGGWSQARYQRSRVHDVDAHLKHVARVLQDLLKVSPYERLLIACTETLFPRVVDQLHPEVRTRLYDARLSLDVGDAAVADVERATEQVLAEAERAREDALLDTLREHLARHDRAAAGLPAVLEALVERRVATLLYDDDLHSPGVICPRCGWMGLEGELCPVDGEQLQARPDIVEEAIQSAVRQSAELHPLHDRPDLGPLGRIAAILRF
jgi:peptide subunit release factor 1 (eRF1)